LNKRGKDRGKGVSVRAKKPGNNFVFRIVTLCPMRFALCDFRRSRYV
jgi:hypothetical protein